MLTVALLAAALGAYWLFLKRDVRPLVARHLPRADPRTQRFVGWLAKGAVLFGLVTIASLALLGRIEAIVAMPVEFVPVHAWLVAQLGPPPGDARDLPYLGASILAGGVLGGVVARFTRGRRGIAFGNVESVMPRRWGELPWAVLLAIDAGLTEELFFRLLLPLLLALVTGNPFAGVGLATALFALAHLYQGWVGVVATGAVGLLLAGVYGWTGQLWTAMLLHALIDLNGLVLRPIVAGTLRRD